jgi:hypothetical protein
LVISSHAGFLNSVGANQAINLQLETLQHMVSVSLSSQNLLEPCLGDTDSRNSSAIVTSLLGLQRGATWSQRSAVPLEGDIFHPQGIIFVTTATGSFYLVSTVNVINRTEALGEGWLIKFSPTGQRLGQLQIGSGASYHPGGMDYDGQYAFVLPSRRVSVRLSADGSCATGMCRPQSTIQVRVFRSSIKWIPCR